MPPEQFPNSRVSHLINGNLGKNIWLLAWPMFISAILQNCQSIIDLFWVGKLGSNAIAALAVSGTVLMLVFPLIMGFSIGTVALISRRVGAGEYKKASEIAFQSLLFSFCTGIIIGFTGYIITGNLLYRMKVDQLVAGMAQEYLHISFLGIFTVFILIVASSALQAAGDAKFPMKIMIISNILNLILDPLFIFGVPGILPGAKVKGAAFATVTAQFISSFIILYHLQKGINIIKIQFSSFVPNIPMLITLIKIGLPASFQMFSRSLMSLVLMHIVAAFGTSSIAAYGIGMRFHMILLMPAFTIGNAAATLVGQNLGARKIYRAVRTAWLAAVIGMIILAAGSMLFFIYASSIMNLFDKNEEVIKIGTGFLKLVSPFYLFSALGIIITRCLQGAGKTIAPMIITIVSLWGFQIPAAIYLPAYFPTTPIYGVWWAMAMTMVLNAVMSTGWFLTGRWKKV